MCETVGSRWPVLASCWNSLKTVRAASSHTEVPSVIWGFSADGMACSEEPTCRRSHTNRQLENIDVCTMLISHREKKAAARKQWYSGDRQGEQANRAKHHQADIRAL